MNKMRLFIIALIVLGMMQIVSAGSYYYSFDSDIEGITIFSMESWGTLIGTLYWSELYGGSLKMGGDYAISIGAGNSTQFFEVGDKLTINFVLNETNYDDHSIGMHFAFCNESYTDFNTGFGYGVDTAIGCTSTYRYNPVTLTNQSGNYFYDDNIYKYVFAKPIDSVSGHYYSLIINRVDSIMFDVAVLDKNTSDYYYSVFNLSDKIGGSNYWFVFGGFSNGASGQWRIFVQDMNLSTSGECVEDWLANYFNQSCNGTYINEIKYYIDNNLCNTTINLPLDNGTISNTYPCNITAPPTESELITDSGVSSAVGFAVILLILLMLVVNIMPKEWLKGNSEKTIMTIVIIILIIVGLMFTLNLFLHFIG